MKIHESGAIVKAINVIGTNLTVYSAWTPVNADNYYTVAFFDGKLHGRIGTHRLPADINAIPIGPERFAAVDAWHAQQWGQAYGLIRDCYPDIAGEESHGEIDVYW